MKTVLITGACGGLGNKMSMYFAEKGWQVIATVHHFDLVEGLTIHPNIKFYALDVTSTESIETAKKEILKDYKTIDVIINNAGKGYRSFVELSTDSEIDSIVNVNWLGVVKTCRAFIPVFRAQNFGQFINITSVAGLVNLPLGNFYHSTKQAIESFSECMSYELIDFNISVCTVQFGNAPTNFQKNVIKSKPTNNVHYNAMMLKIDTILAKKTCKNNDLIDTIVEKIYRISENPKKSFRRYAIGFDANFMKYFRRILCYRAFNFVIKKKIL
ncbi:SDR family NAD(P)-dependent oxidoreductase [Flavobacterium gelidilacus]|uniref:SDR family NAD(P)-dependent oxidoreductase n=1 Tax=Flavobacterium gelidilacus TaxID=206041 RepID=UPI0003FE09F5|nr:SDR family NAD(P)-dependent oxidoreductase [Flavobacterium gelidilacus]